MNASGAGDEILEPDERTPQVQIVHGSVLSWRPWRRFQVIVTDPPYYDDVPYPELMEFFQVWYSRTLGGVLDLHPTPSTSEELSVGADRDKETFERRMLVAIQRLRDLLEDDGLLVMFYAHKSIDGWKYVLEGLRKEGFTVTMTHALRTEGGGLISRGKSSVFHSLLLTARKRHDERKTTIVDLEDEIRRKMESRHDDLVSVYGDDRVSLMVAASGMVIESITSYSEVKSFTTDTADYALGMGQKYIIELFVQRSLKLGPVDPKTTLYVWLRHDRSVDIPFSEFNQTLKSVGLTEDAVSDITRKVKDRSYVRLLDYSQRGALEVDGEEPMRPNSVIDAVHVALRAYLRGGVTAAYSVMKESVYGVDTILCTIHALARAVSVNSGYEEGKMCDKFLKDWSVLYGKGYAGIDPAQRTIEDYY